jgi:hypothetical protein
MGPDKGEEVMSQLVMIEFHDPDAANAFVQNAVLASQLDYERVGMWLMPQSTCECKLKPNLANWSRKNKAGIPVCRKCHKPSVVWRGGLGERLWVALGRNKLQS